MAGTSEAPALSECDLLCHRAGTMSLYKRRASMASQVEVLEKGQPDGERAAAFAERMLGVMNDACLALMTSVGHRTGLFDTMARRPPSTAAQVADAAGLNERYVREWLGAMVVGRIVDYLAERTPTPCRRPTPPASRAMPPRTTWRRSPSTFPCSARSKTGSSNASREAAGFPTPTSPGSKASWPRTAGSRSCPLSSSTSCPWFPGSRSGWNAGSTCWTWAAAPVWR